MRALVIGFGKMGMLHAATLRALPGIEEVVIAENTGFIRDGLQALAPHLRVFESHQDALKHGPVDLAVITTPNETHFGIFSDLITRGVSVYVEKPFMTSSEEVEKARVLVAAQARPPHVMVGYCLRFLNSVEQAKRLLDAGALGKVARFEASMYSSDVLTRPSGWRFGKSKRGGGVVLDLGSHVVDIVRHFWGMPRAVKASVRSVHSEVDDQAHADFDYGDLVGTLDVSWSVPEVRKPAVTIRAAGSNGTFSLVHERLEIDLKESAGGFTAGKTLQDAVSHARSVPFDLAGPFYTLQMAEFVSAVQGGRPHRNTLAESMGNHQILDRILA